MPRATWPLRRGGPSVEISLTFAIGGQTTSRHLLADTGAGSATGAFELILEENDCLLCGGNPTLMVQLGGAHSGSFPVYGIRVRVPQIGFDDELQVVGVPSLPSGIDGIAGFRFLRRFTFGNFGNPDQFGLDS